jgi:hypothetical protein
MKSYTLNGYSYFHEDKNAEIKEIKYNNHKIELPRTLFKYYKLNEDNVNVILKSEIYASKTEELNDLFESCFEVLDFSEMTLDDYIKVFKFITFEQKKGFELEIGKIYNKDISRLNFEVVDILKKILNHDIGFYCLTDDKLNENELIWSHYTNNAGFKIEYDFSNFNNGFIKGPYPINYTRTFQKIKLKNHLDSYFDLAFISLVNSLVKKDIWEYENEYRFFCFLKINDSKNQKFKINPKSIKRITFSFIFFNYYKIEDTSIESDCKKYIFNLTVPKNEFLSNSKMKEFEERSNLSYQLLNFICTNKIYLNTIAYDKDSLKLIAVPSEIRHINDWRFELTLFNVSDIN